LREFLKDHTKLAHIYEIANLVFSINQMGFGCIIITHAGLREDNRKIYYLTLEDNLAMGSEEARKGPFSPAKTGRPLMQRANDEIIWDRV
jgi:hypothetical protein